MVVAASLFLLSLLGICGLFALKNWEAARNRILVPAFRERADERALQLKDLAIAARKDLSMLGPLSVRLVRLLVHEGALAFARLARMMERGAHRLADLVSHKHRFEKRETRSEFLRKVAEHKHGGLDTTAEDVQN